MSREERIQSMGHLLAQVSTAASVELLDGDLDPAVHDQIVRVRDDCRALSRDLNTTGSGVPRTVDAMADDFESVSKATFHRRL